MKHRNKLLLILLLVLLCAFVATKFFRSPALESNLDMERFRLDTAGLTSLILRSPHSNDGAKLTLKRNDSSWTIRQGNKTAPVRTLEIRRLLGTLNTVEPERIVTRREEKWHQYQVDDSTAVRLIVLDENDDKLAEWLIGKESQGATYVRHAGESDVYAVAGGLRSNVDKDFNEWRDRTFLKVAESLVDKLTFRYPADSGFVLEKKGTAWMIGDRQADSSRVAGYLNTVELKELNRFEDGFSPADQPLATLIIRGAPVEIQVNGWKDTGDDWIVSSSLQEDVYFRDPSFAGELFRGKTWFLNDASDQ